GDAGRDGLPGAILRALAAGDEGVDDNAEVSRGGNHAGVALRTRDLARPVPVRRLQLESRRSCAVRCGRWSEEWVVGAVGAPHRTSGAPLPPGFRRFCLDKLMRPVSN